MDRKLDEWADREREREETETDKKKEKAIEIKTNNEIKRIQKQERIIWVVSSV